LLPQQPFQPLRLRYVTMEVHILLYRSKSNFYFFTVDADLAHKLGQEFECEAKEDEDCLTLHTVLQQQVYKRE
jgi:hypothetical protein